ncbi:hypothetical protein SCHPADRAFT_884535 [Schizopora paradoxa]|uniref:Uncharacterized protein n=1 Tax=Schizopora paradoxa TaxID=27342 RepID=A0A0H2S879_9AGAM|nr:hypothetical protein SCHPADRAFT_884535 [Schizopora paradoxa]
MPSLGQSKDPWRAGECLITKFLWELTARGIPITLFSHSELQGESYGSSSDRTLNHCTMENGIKKGKVSVDPSLDMAIPGYLSSTLFDFSGITLRHPSSGVDDAVRLTLYVVALIEDGSVNMEPAQLMASKQLQIERVVLPKRQLQRFPLTFGYAKFIGPMLRRTLSHSLVLS